MKGRPADEQRPIEINEVNATSFDQTKNFPFTDSREFCGIQAREPLDITLALRTNTPAALIADPQSQCLPALVEKEYFLGSGHRIG